MASSLSIEEGEWALFETVMGRVKLNPSLHPKVVSTQYGWWQECQQLGLPAYDALGPGGANVNLLFSNDAFDPISGSVAHRSLMCRVRKETVPVQDCAI